MDIEEEGRMSSENHGIHSPFPTSPETLKEHYPVPTLVETHLHPYSYPIGLTTGPHIEPEMLPLSMPLNLAHLSSPSFGSSVPLLASASSQDSHFNYDEQLAEDFDESEDDSSVVQIGPSLASSSSTRSFSDLQEYQTSPEWSIEPRRSHRERRPPTVFVLPSPPENPKPHKKPGRPGKNTPARTRGRPRKHPLPTTTPAVVVAPIPPHNTRALYDSVTSPDSTYSASTNSPGSMTPISLPSLHSAPVRSLPSQLLDNRASLTGLYPMDYSTPQSSLPESGNLTDFLPPTEAFGFATAPSLSSDMAREPCRRFPALQQFTGPAETWFKAPNSEPTTTSTLPGSAQASGSTVTPSHSSNFSATATSWNQHRVGTRSHHHSDPTQTFPPAPKLKFTLQVLQTLECKSGITCMSLSPCGQLLACGTLLGQIFVYAAEGMSANPSMDSSSGPSPVGDITFSQHPTQTLQHPQQQLRQNLLPSPAPTSATKSESTAGWEHVKWVQVAVLQDYNEDFIDEWWNILWTADSKKLIVSGSCKSRHIWDENDHDLKVIPCPVVIFNLEHHLETSKEDTKAQSERGKGRGAESHHYSTNPKSRGAIMSDLARESDFTPQINYSHAGIKRFHGHAEEIVDMKIWHISEQASHRSGSRPIIETLLITSSQDGHIRKWKFDDQWQKLEYSAEMRDETTWMAFSVAQVSFSETNIPQPQQPAGLFLLAGDTTLKLFDLTTNQCLFTFEDIYDAYCTNVELLQLSTGLEHPWMPGIYLNGSGNVYRDVSCSQLVEDFAPTFLVLTKGIDVMTQPKIETIKKAKVGRESDSEDFDEDDFVPRKSEPKPTRVLLHVLTLPLVSMPRAMPSTSAKKLEAVAAARRLSVDIQNLELQTVMNFSHPLYDCNYWPSNLTHNGQHVLSVGSKGTVFAWNILQSNVSRTANVQPYSHQHQHSHQQQVTAGGQGQATSGTGAGLASNLHQAQSSQTPRATINASSHISAILASHEEDSMVRDVIFHPYWPFLFTSSDDASIHVWAPSIFDPGSATPKPSSNSDNPANAHSVISSSTAVNPTQPDTPSLVSQMTTPCIVVPKGATLAFSKMLPNGIPQAGLLHGQQQQQQGSVYRTAIEAAMMASVGSLLPPVAKRKRGRPPKKRIIEEIEAQFAAQERALNAAQQQVQIINPFPDSNT